MESLVIQESKGKKNLDAVMKALYDLCQKKGRGYTEEDFLDILDSFIGKKAKSLFKYTINKAGDIHVKVGKALSSLGVEMKDDDSDTWASYYGLKFSTEPQPKVLNVHSASEAYAQGIRVGMTLIGLDNIWIESDLLTLPVNNRVELQMKDGKVLKVFVLNKSKKAYYLQFNLTKKSGKEGASWKAWKA
jgi:predicted metalloprotease with PDZ domain